MVKFNIPVDEEPPNVGPEWENEVDDIPDVTKSLQNPDPGLFIAVFDSRSEPSKGVSNSRHIFDTADVRARCFTLQVLLLIFLFVLDLLFVAIERTIKRNREAKTGRFDSS